MAEEQKLQCPVDIDIVCETTGEGLEARLRPQKRADRFAYSVTVHRSRSVRMVLTNHSRIELHVSVVYPTAGVAVIESGGMWRSDEGKQRFAILDQHKRRHCFYVVGCRIDTGCALCARQQAPPMADALKPVVRSAPGSPDIRRGWCWQDKEATVRALVPFVQKMLATYDDDGMQ